MTSKPYNRETKSEIKPATMVLRQSRTIVEGIHHPLPRKTAKEFVNRPAHPTMSIGDLDVNDQEVKIL